MNYTNFLNNNIRYIPPRRPRLPNEPWVYPDKPPYIEEEFDIKSGINLGKYKNKLTYVGIVLDRSGSMLRLKTEVVSGYNEQLNLLKSKVNKNHKVKLSLTTFSTGVDEIEGPTDVNVLSKLVSNKYNPEGMTALYDAVASTIKNLNSQPIPTKTDVAYLLIIISDGAENNSKEYDSHRLRNIVTNCQNKNWTFVYLGSNQNLAKVSSDTGIVYSNMVCFSATPDGYDSVVRGTNFALNSYMDSRNIGVTKSLFFDNKNKE